MLALVACLAWISGVEGLPALHQAHHDDHHTHDASGAVIDHGDAHVDADRDDDLNQLAIDHPVAPRHESGGLAHHAVALHSVTSPAIAPVIALESRVELAHVAIELPHRSTQPSARGPPAKA